GLGAAVRAGAGTGVAGRGDGEGGAALATASGALDGAALGVGGFLRPKRRPRFAAEPALGAGAGVAGLGGGLGASYAPMLRL
ncbi:MAG: serine/threonine protein kinase, partial [Candidatus Velthaea sp.]